MLWRRKLEKKERATIPDSPFLCSVNITERDRRVIWHPFTQAKTARAPLAVIKAEGCWLTAENGERYLDGTASWWVNAHGHGHPYIARAIAEQAQQLEHVIFAGFTHEPAVELAERLLDLLPGKQERIFYSDNGSTSVEVALKMALQYFHNHGEQRIKIVAFRNGYHGDTFGGMSVAERNAFNLPFQPFLFDVQFIEAPEPGRGAESIRQLQEILDEGDVAAFIFEPLVQGVAGMRMHDAAVLSQLIRLCREQDVIIIADEVFTGFYRTGQFFACNYLAEQPDIICLSKALTGGFLTLGVTAVPSFIYEAFRSDDKIKTFFHGHSFTANPIACRAALASLDLFEQDTFHENIRRISEQHATFAASLSHHPALIAVRHKGTILALELKTGEESGYLNPVSEDLTSWFLQRNIYLRPLGNVLYITPPYCISTEELQLIYTAIREWLETATPA